MNPLPDTTPEIADRSYISAAVESLSPWAIYRTSSPKLNISGDGSGLRNQLGGDRITNQRHGPSRKIYPPDCPPLCPRWCYAVDVPKRKPKLLNISATTTQKNLPAPKKFATFSEHDSQAIEAAYQQLIDECDETLKDTSNNECMAKSPFRASQKPNTSISEAGIDEKAGGRVRVPVQEDYLFDVDVERRELSPVYWLGPIYEVRRGSWFYQEGTNLRPCEENLSAQLEEGYLKIKPFRYPKTSEAPSSGVKTSNKIGDNRTISTSSSTSSRHTSESKENPSQESAEDVKSGISESSENFTASPKEPQVSAIHQPQTYRLFGTYMNNVVTYIDTTVAWLSVDSIMSRVSSTVYQKFAGGGYLGGVKLVRGYIEINKTKDSSDKKITTTTLNIAAKDPSQPENLQPGVETAHQKAFKRRSATISFENQKKKNPSLASSKSELNEYSNKEFGSEDLWDNEIQGNFSNREDTQGRQIDHLILCTHGIGQRLGMRTETVNFVNDVNILRQNLKNVYENSADLQALNSEIDKVPKNCRIQVLPICWRHLLDFPRRGEKQTKSEHDLGDALGDEEEYPSLEDITVEGVPFVRSLITDLAVDILLFQSAYREHICNIVLTESNRIYNLFKERNPDFKGKVSLLGHSLGSAILFDLLSRQKEITLESGLRAKHQNKRPSSSGKTNSQDLDFLFDVEDFYCYGSPIGLFQMLKGQNIKARQPIPDETVADLKIDSDYLQDPYSGANSASKFLSPHNVSNPAGMNSMASSPKVGRLYNIFHPSDPIAYRLEPLISPAMSSMKPQLLPFTKRTISSSMSGIGAKVGQSVSGILTSLSSGLASSLFNRSLGLTNDDIARMESPALPRYSSGLGPIAVGGAITDEPTLKREETSEKKKQLAENTALADREGSGGTTVATLIDEDIETLYSGFQKARQINQTSKNSDRLAAEEKGKKLKREEAKIRALNSNGRVDYSLQETFMDINPMNTIASHMSYWADEDFHTCLQSLLVKPRYNDATELQLVSHFMMSQLLSRYRKPSPGNRIERTKNMNE